ncbi:MAG: hypothetical protein CL596_07535 [Alteromonas sp.]|nr:hypothetical protein [Alteromonas sp.]MAY22595.1 hypothetical protein [Flavobacteriaceae bacterium]|tara:strand:+ start:42293 stop:42649 length:357 start_codon:yes stop_codon:yes gene_type:complete
MKKPLILFIVFSIIGFAGTFILLKSLKIEDPKPSECEIVEVTIDTISEGSSYDIVFKDSQNDKYYINRGLERGLSLDDLNSRVLNKKVTLHLAKLWVGTSEHIAQMQVGDEVIFTEFD